jgi:hypothetical protein
METLQRTLVSAIGGAVLASAAWWFAWPQTAPPPQNETAASPVVPVQPPLECPEVDCLPEGDIDALRMQQGLLEKMLEDALDAERGTPLRWPEELPEAFTAEGYEEAWLAAIEECNLAVELVDMHCDEPPCLAVLRGEGEGWYEDLWEDCPRFSEAYPKKGAQYFWDIDCPEGVVQGAAMAWSPWLVPELEPVEFEDRENFGRRILHRAEDIRDDFPCER